MLRKEKIERNTLEFVSTEHLVPQEHLLRKIDAAIDFTHIYDFVEELYCKDNGRPSIDPVVLFKMVLIQHLFGIPSLRRTVEEINMNIAYRWFLGYLIGEQLPHFATISYNFRHRFSEDTIEKVFTWILFEADHSGYLSPEVVFLDATHIKANANINKKMKQAIPALKCEFIKCKLQMQLKQHYEPIHNYYEERNLEIAVEKLWDAFERLKTYYSSTLDKKKSVNKIICDMSSNLKPYEEIFEKEFHELTAIGNNFRIRHHETTKTDIEDNRHYDYFYKRCLA